MLKTRHILSIILALVLLGLASEQPLKAYADPGSGAMFVQILLAAIIGGLFRIRRVIDRFRGKKNDQEQVKFPSVPTGSLVRSPK
jgi:hypothetical protein